MVIQEAGVRQPALVTAAGGSATEEIRLGVAGTPQLLPPPTVPPQIVLAPTMPPQIVPAPTVPPQIVPPSRAGIRLLPQAGIVAAAVAAYFLVRGATDSAATGAIRNAGRVIDLERALALYHEPALQDALARSAGVRTVLNWVYIWGHWPVIVVTLLWLARRHPEMFRRTRNAMMVSGGIGLVLFALFPVAPPRLADLGMADTVSLTSHSYRVLQPAFFTNQFAAMPSLHVGWNLLIGLAIVTAARSVVVRIIGAAMPAAMTVAVVLTANHFIVDALAGAALTTACWYLLALRRESRRQPGRHRMPYRLPAFRSRPSA